MRTHYRKCVHSTHSLIAEKSVGPPPQNKIRLSHENKCEHVMSLFVQKIGKKVKCENVAARTVCSAKRAGVQKKKKKELFL